MASSFYKIQMFHMPKAFRLGELVEQAEFTVLSCEDMARYVIPTFNVFTVPLRPLRINTAENDGIEYNIFAHIALYWTEIIQL